MATDSLGSLSVDLIADLSGLQEAIDGAAGLAAIGAQKIEDAFSVPDLGADMTAGVEGLTGALEGAGQAAGASVAPLQESGSAAHEAGGAFSELGESAKGLLESLGEIAALAGVSVTLGEIAKEAIEAYSAVQLATVSLAALTGSASGAAETIERLKTTAQADALAFPQLVQAQQRMTALGFTASESTAAIQSIADAAAAVGNNFEAVASSFDRIALSGTASSRTLVQLGLSMGDLAAAMGVTDGEAKKVFASLDMEDRITVLNEALQKFSGVAAAAADTVAGHWQQFQNTLDFAFEEIGKTAAPAITELIDDLQAIVPPLTQVIGLFGGEVVTQFATAITAFKGVSAAAVDLEAALSNLLGIKPLVGDLGLSLSTLSGDVANAMFHLRDLADLLNLMAAAMEYVSGKSPSMQASVADVTKQLVEEQKAATEGAIDLDKLLAAIDPQAAAHDKMRASASAAADALTKASGATEAWTKTGKDALAIVNESTAAFRAYNDALANSPSESEFGAGLDKLIDKLSKTKQAMVDDTTSGYNWHLQIGLLTQEINTLASGGLQTAQAAMDALTQKTNDDTKAVDAMAKTISGEVNVALKEYVTIATSRQKLDADTLTGTKAYDTFLKSEHIPTFATLNDALTNLDALHQTQIDDAAKLNDALTAENALRETNSTDIAADTAATQAAKDARDALGISTAAVNQAESDLQANYGLSTAASILMANTMNDEGTAAGNLALAYQVMGDKTAATYKALADAAHAAYEQIANDASASDTEQLNAAIKSLQAQAAEYENTGSGSVPAALQIQLANMKQQQKDFAAESQTQWITLFNSIDATVQKTSTDMIEVLVGNKKGSFKAEVLQGLADIGVAVLQEFVKPFEDAVARLMAGAITNLLGSSGLGGITSALGQIGNFFGIGTSAALGGAGSAAAGVGAAGAGSGAASAATGITSAFSTITSAVTAISSAIGAIAGVFGDIQNAHMESDLQKIEGSTRYLAIYTGEQSENLLWCAQQTQGNTNLALDELQVIDAQVSTSRETLGYILGQLVLIAGSTAQTVAAIHAGTGPAASTGAGTGTGSGGSGGAGNGTASGPSSPYTGTAAPPGSIHTTHEPGSQPISTLATSLAANAAIQAQIDALAPEVAGMNRAISSDLEIIQQMMDNNWQNDPNHANEIAQWQEKLAADKATLAQVLQEIIDLQGGFQATMPLLPTLPPYSPPGGSQAYTLLPYVPPSAPFGLADNLPGADQRYNIPVVPSGEVYGPPGNQRGGAGGAITVNITIPGSGSPAHTARAVAQHLRTISSKFGVGN